MGELRAAIEGFEVVVEVGGGDLPDRVRTALAELAEALYEQRLAAAEVSGYNLSIGSLGLDRHPGPIISAPRMPVGAAWSCWGYDREGGSCMWYSGGLGDVQTCGLYTVE